MFSYREQTVEKESEEDGFDGGSGPETGPRESVSSSALFLRRPGDNGKRGRISVREIEEQINTLQLLDADSGLHPDRSDRNDARALCSAPQPWPDLRLDFW